MRSLRGQIGAYESWAKTPDRAARTWPARKAALDELEVDPEGVLTPQQRAKRAEWARKAHIQRLALKSAAARQRRIARFSSGLLSFGRFGSFEAGFRRYT